MKKIIMAIFIILSINFLIGCNENNKQTGNTNEEILQFLKSADFLNNMGKDNLRIADVKYVNDSKIVGFISDTGLGFVAYKKDSDGDYIMQDNMAKRIGNNDIGAATFHVLYDPSLDGLEAGYLVLSNGKEVSSVQITINNHVYDESMEVGNPSMIFLYNILSESELKNVVSYKCRYFDINKNEISNNN